MTNYRFVQDCPTCGRKLRIRLDLLGREVACKHCCAEFIAQHTEGVSASVPAKDPLLDRVEAAMQKAQAFVETGVTSN